MPPKSAKPATNVTELPVAARPAAAPAEEGAVAVVKARAVLKKKDFLDRVVARAGIRKSDAKAGAEATLAALAAALAEGQEIVLPPLGKIKVVREKAAKSGRQFVLRLAMPADAAATEALAEGDD